jgi:hypothetical protein
MEPPFEGLKHAPQTILEGLMKLCGVYPLVKIPASTASLATTYYAPVIAKSTTQIETIIIGALKHKFDQRDEQRYYDEAAMKARGASPDIEASSDVEARRKAFRIAEETRLARHAAEVAARKAAAAAEGSEALARFVQEEAERAAAEDAERAADEAAEDAKHAAWAAEAGSSNPWVICRKRVLNKVYDQSLVIHELIRVDRASTFVTGVRALID